MIAFRGSGFGRKHNDAQDQERAKLRRGVVFNRREPFTEVKKGCPVIFHLFGDSHLWYFVGTR